MLILCAKTNQNHAVLGSERNGASQLDSPGNWCQEKEELRPIFFCVDIPLRLFLQSTAAQECAFEYYFPHSFLQFKTPGVWIASVVSSLVPFYVYLCKKYKLILFEMQSEF